MKQADFDGFFMLKQSFLLKNILISPEKEIICEKSFRSRAPSPHPAAYNIEKKKQSLTGIFLSILSSIASSFLIIIIKSSPKPAARRSDEGRRGEELEPKETYYMKKKNVSERREEKKKFLWRWQSAHDAEPPCDGMECHNHWHEIPF